jgi:hypothetical protein
MRGHEHVALRPTPTPAAPERRPTLGRWSLRQQPVENGRVSAIHVEYLRAACGACHQRYRVTADTERRGNRGHCRRRGPAIHGGRADPHDQRAVVIAAHARMAGAGSDPDRDPHDPSLARGRPSGQEQRRPLSACQVRSGPWMTCKVTTPDWTVTPRPTRLTSRQPPWGMPGMPPCRENQTAAATGDRWPPRSDTRDRANPDLLVHEELAAGATPGAGAAADPQAAAARRHSSRPLPKATWRTLMLLGRASRSGGSRYPPKASVFLRR